MNWLLKRAIGWAGRRLDGYKTKIGGVGLILAGVVGAINLMFPEAVPGFPPMTLEGVIGNIGGGFAVLGIGGKLDKNTAAVEVSSVGTVIVENQTIVTPELTEEQRATLNGP